MTMAAEKFNEDMIIEFADDNNIDADAFCEFLNLHNHYWADLEDALSDFEDKYMGQYENKIDYAYEYVENTDMLDNVPENVARYFDYEAFARDLFMCDLTMTESGYVFSNY